MAPRRVVNNIHHLVRLDIADGGGGGGDGIGDDGDIGGDGDIADGGDMDVFPIPFGTFV